MIEAEFAELMVDSITVAAETSTRTLYGNATLAAGVAHRCRIVQGAKMVRTLGGDEVTSIAHAWVFGAPGIRTTDRITLPDGTTPPVLSVERYPDENGAHHEVVYW